MSTPTRYFRRYYVQQITPPEMANDWQAIGLTTSSTVFRWFEEIATQGLRLVDNEDITVMWRKDKDTGAGSVTVVAKVTTSDERP